MVLQGVLSWGIPLALCPAAHFPGPGSMESLPALICSSSDLAPNSHKAPWHPAPPHTSQILRFIFPRLGLLCWGVSADVSLFKPCWVKGRKERETPEEEGDVSQHPLLCSHSKARKTRPLLIILFVSFVLPSYSPLQNKKNAQTGIPCFLPS